ncbi:peptidase S41 [Desulfonatronospira thiodismutans ASO3-1]|uniref:Peptidase S41 n=2 Tax=Desulfonatronospira TaxID=488937 RepID=D6SLH4_9BACT|nr:S41 family peptidase [Desulfonatronospira thiodismutans]EFI35535.1 peptidase S41 [Desulfonatronospira thiodismutans ASO3-1]
MKKHLPWLFLLLFFFPADLAAKPLLEEIRQVLRQHLPDPPDEALLQSLSKDTLQDDLQSLDAYARYFAKGESVHQTALEAQYTGIGAEIFSRDEEILVSPYQDGPLARAGVTERSVLLEVNGIRVAGEELEKAAAMLQGPPGKMVDLKLRPLSGEDMVELRVKREAVRPLHVELLQPQDQAVLRIRDFAAGRTRASLRVSIDYLGAGSSPVFIDLRESTGGDLFEALDCAALFIEPGKSLGGLWTKKSGKTLVNSPPGEKLSGRIVVFTGPDTASAAEAFAAALKFHGKALLAGEPSYGKCSTQTRISLSDGSVLQMTNGYVLGPEETPCSPEGLQPDIKVAGSRLYDTAYLVREGLAALEAQDALPETRQQYTLQQLAEEDLLTVRALRAWDRLPSGYVSLVLNLVEHDMDLLGANQVQVRIWSDKARNSDDPDLARHAGELESLAEYMEKSSWR